MRKRHFLIAFVTVIAYSIPEGIKGWRDNSSKDNNICSHIVKFKTVHLNKTLIVNITKTVLDCCKGYEKVENTCVPICYYGCFSGECIAPNTCLCFEGWTGPLCQEKCKPNEYGRGCKNKCSCLHGSTCDSKDGSCQCIEGYIGAQCEFPCPNHTYGLNCKQECMCYNDAFCDIKDGSCDCQPGYYGDHCENPCNAGTHGENCEQTCICFNDTTEHCSHVDGKCICKPGYTGDYCERKCSNFTFGRGCAGNCDCENSDFCDPVTGECLCDPGWRGKLCSERCEKGTFGENCQFNCSQCANSSGFCHPVTGVCTCPPGTMGLQCEKECDLGFWGRNCSEKCSCLNDGVCIPENGHCECLPGWAGTNCSEACKEGTFGFNCSKRCDCPRETTCDPATGMCSLKTENSTHVKESPASGLTINSHPRNDIKVFLIIIYILISVAFVSFLLVIIWYAYRKKWFSRKLVCVDEGKSTETIVNSNFSNPSYDTAETVGGDHGASKVQSPNSHMTNAIFYDKHNILNPINDAKPERLSSDSMSTRDSKQSTSNQGKRANSWCVKKKSRASSSGSETTVSCHNSFVSHDDSNERYEPETLQDFCVEDLYETVQFRNPFQQEKLGPNA